MKRSEADVTIYDIRIPFLRLVIILFTIGLAAIPAGVLLSLVVLFCHAILAGILLS